jgi:uncharacterized protein (UPF0332 family)
VKSEGALFLAKARESLASASADAKAGRHNSAANRGYYAVFQAAVSALIHEGIRPQGEQWQHRFVNSQFSGKLVRRRKLLDPAFPALLDDLFRMRIVGDYEPDDVSARDAARAVGNARRIVEGVESMTQLKTLGEADAEYDTQVLEGQGLADRAARRIAVIQSMVTSNHPEARFGVSRLGPKDYRVNAFIDGATFEFLAETLGSVTTDILIEDDLWIVVVPQDISKLSSD